MRCFLYRGGALLSFRTRKGFKKRPHDLQTTSWISDPHQRWIPPLGNWCHSSQSKSHLPTKLSSIVMVLFWIPTLTNTNYLKPRQPSPHTILTNLRRITTLELFWLLWVSTYFLFYDCPLHVIFDDFFSLVSISFVCNFWVILVMCMRKRRFKSTHMFIIALA